MALELVGYEEKARESVMAFWGNRDAAAKKQRESGNLDAGTRGAVTAGKNMDGFVALMMQLVRANGLGHARILQNKGVVTLPGYFRPTKLWDMLVINEGRLVAALEFKSQVGSFGNNFNNRTEEAIGTAHDLWTAYREHAFGADAPRPFVGWLMLVEDCSDCRVPVKNVSPHFDVFPEFKGASYAERYNILCKRLVQEQLYTAASVLLSPKTAVGTGAYSVMSDLTSLTAFVTSFAGHIATEAARSAPHQDGRLL